MNKVYTLIGVLLLSTSAFAQSDWKSTEKSPIEPMSERSERTGTIVKEGPAWEPLEAPIVGTPEAVTTIWSSNFDNAGDWTAGSVGPVPPAPATWSIGDSTTQAGIGNGIEWFGNVIATSGAFAYLNVNNLVQGGTTYTITLTTTNAIDITANTPDVGLFFDQYYAAFTDEVFFEISSNGTSWVEVGNNNHIDITSQQNPGIKVSNPDNNYYDMSAALTSMGSPSSVFFRINYTGDLGYGIMIDNVSFSTLPQNNLVTVQNFFEIDAGVTDSTSNKWYASMPLRQAEAVAVEFSALINNEGSLTQTNSQMEVTITDPNGTTEVRSSSAYTSLTGASDTTQMTGMSWSGGIDLLGAYEFDFQAVSDSGSGDVNTSQSGITDEMEVTNTYYARDNGSSNGGITFSGNLGAHTMLVHYEIATQDSILGLNVNFFDNSQSGNGTSVGAFFDVVLFNTLDAAATPIAEVKFVEVGSGDLNADKVVLFNSPVPVAPGDYYIGYTSLSAGDDFWLNAGSIDDDYEVPTQRYFIRENGAAQTSFFTREVFVRMLTKSKIDLCAGTNIFIGDVITYSLLNFDADISLTATGGTSPYAYSWGANAGNVNTKDITVTETGTYSVTVTDANGCSSTSDILVDNINQGPGNVSVDELGADLFSFKVFPNPNNGEFTLNIENAVSGAYTIEVKNILGQNVHNEVLSIDGNTTKVLNLNNLDKGVYFLNVSNASSEKSQKVIIK